MSVLWTTPIMEEINALEWASKAQKKEMKRMVIRLRIDVEQRMGMYELQYRRGIDVGRSGKDPFSKKEQG